MLDRAAPVKPEKELSMLRTRNIRVGRYYVNKARDIAREVLAIDDKIVTFNTHHLDTGNSCQSPSECTIRDFIHWADHGATSSELTSLHNRQMEVALYTPELENLEDEQLTHLEIEPEPTALVGETAFHQHLL